MACFRCVEVSFWAGPLNREPCFNEVRKTVNLCSIILVCYELTVSLPSRERGLKPWPIVKFITQWNVAPFTGAWIETSTTLTQRGLIVSLPSRERGLKLCRIAAAGPLPASLPSRGRGLKPLFRGSGRIWDQVAPFTGAWIETKLLMPADLWSWVAPFTGAWLNLPFFVLMKQGPILTIWSLRCRSFRCRWLEFHLLGIVLE
jgi:hypothetical protein